MLLYALDRVPNARQQKNVRATRANAMTVRWERSIGGGTKPVPGGNSLSTFGNVGAILGT